MRNFAFDATGIGNYLRAYTSGIPITANRRPIQEFDEEGNSINLDMYYNVRSQLMSRLEVMIQKGELNFAIPRDMIIPYGKNGKTERVIDIMYKEVYALVFTTKGGKIYARSKDEYKAKFHTSPNLIDSLSLFMYFFLNPKAKKGPKKRVADNTYSNMMKRPRMVNPWIKYKH